MFYQTVGEIERLWGRAGMSSWRDGCSATIMGPVSSRTSAQDLSAMMGTRMLRVKTESTSASSPVMSPMSGSVSTSEQEQLRDVALITPTAISQLPPHASIITATGRKPILASKAIWFTREDMKDRVRNTDEIKDELAVTEEQEKLTKRLRELSQVDEETARWASVSRADLVAMQRRNMDDDPDPDDGARLMGQCVDMRPLSERARARGPRYGPAEGTGGRSKHGGGQVSGHPQPGSQTTFHRDATPERAASGAPAETGDIDPGAVRIEDDLEPPGGLDGSGANDAQKPGAGIPSAGNAGDPVSPEAARPVAEADPLPGDEDEGCVPAEEDREPDPRDVDRPPSEAEEVSARTDDPDDPADASSESGSGETETAASEDGDRPPEASRGTLARAQATGGASPGASARPMAESSASSEDIDPGAIEIEEDFEPHWLAAESDPTPAPSGADERAESYPENGVDEARGGGARRAEPAGPGTPEGSQSPGTQEGGASLASGHDNASEAVPEGEGSGQENAEAKDAVDASESVAPSRLPAAAANVDPSAVEIEDDLEPPWSVAGPAPAPGPSGSDERAESVPGDVADAGTWTSVERATFMSLSDAGMSLADIAGELGKSLAAVEAWMAGQSMQGLMPDGVGDGIPDDDEPDDHGSRGPA